MEPVSHVFTEYPHGEALLTERPSKSFPDIRMFPGYPDADILSVAHIFSQKPGQIHRDRGQLQATSSLTRELTVIIVAMAALAFQPLAIRPLPIQAAEIRTVADRAIAIWALGTPAVANQAQTPATGGRAQQPGGQPPLRGRRGPPEQPQQRQSAEYFVGSWHFEWTGRESAVSVGPRTGTVTFTRKDDGNALDMQTEGQTDAGATYKESGTAEWNDAQKTLTFREQLSNGVELLSPGNWSSPLSIRSESQPVRAGSQTIRVRRTYMIISAQSFTLAEELSIDGGPFQRLGSATFSKSQP